jgi:hypothetical protein
MYQIDPERIDLAEEFRENIYGRHGGELQRVLNRMRFGDEGDRYVLIADKARSPERPAGGWILARMGTRHADPVIPVPGSFFHTLEEAEWAVFKLRWKDLTGRALPLD